MAGLTLKEAKKVLGKRREKFTDEQLREILPYVNQLARISYNKINGKTKSRDNGEGIDL